MPFDPTTDFPNIIDRVETVSLRRFDTGVTTGGLTAWRRSLSRGEAERSGGGVLAADAAWHIAQSALASPPRVNDQLIAGSEAFTLLAVMELSLVGQWRCRGRNLAIAAGLNESVTVQIAVWTETDGVATAAWTTFRASLAVRIQPIAGDVTDRPESRLRNATHRVFAAESFAVNENYRVIDGDGRVFDVLSYEQPAQIDALCYWLVRETVPVLS